MSNATEEIIALLKVVEAMDEQSFIKSSFSAKTMRLAIEHSDDALVMVLEELGRELAYTWPMASAVYPEQISVDVNFAVIRLDDPFGSFSFYFEARCGAYAYDCHAYYDKERDRFYIDYDKYLNGAAYRNGRMFTKQHSHM